MRKEWSDANGEMYYDEEDDELYVDITDLDIEVQGNTPEDGYPVTVDAGGWYGWKEWNYLFGNADYDKALEILDKEENREKIYDKIIEDYIDRL